MPTNGASRPAPVVLFARNFFKHPKMLGSLIPSSRFLVNHLLSLVDWQTADVIVEYGPGVGNITKEILKRMKPQSRLVVIEMNSDFAAYLKHEYPDPRLHVVHGSATEVREVLERLGIEQANYIISGIPYTTMPEDTRRQVLDRSRAALHPGGAFLVYQFTRTVLPYLTPIFGRVQQDFEPLNILPARLFYCTP